MGFVTKLVNSNGFVTTYEYDKYGQQIKSEAFDDKGVRYYYSTVEYSTSKINNISTVNPQVNSKGGLLIISSYGNNIYYSKRNTTYNLKNGVETKSSDVLFDYKLDNNGKIQSLTSTNNINNIATTRTYNYQECE
jgi:YD repeat-containing protein